MDMERREKSSTSVERLREWLTQNKFLIIAIILLANSILRGIEAPGRWPYTHMLFNYDFGFSKRAFFGAIISTLGVPALYRYNFFFWFSIAIFSANITLLIGFLKRLCATANAPSMPVALIFSSSLAVVFLSHTVGYADQIGLLVTLLALRTDNFYLRCVFVAVLFSASVLIHDAMFVIFFPVILFRFLADLGYSPEKRKLICVSAVVVCVFAAVICTRSARLSEAAATAMLESLQKRADYPLRKDELFVLTSTFSDNLNLISTVWRLPVFKRFFLYVSIVTLPTTCYVIYRSLVILRQGGHPGAMGIVAVLASLAPLSLQFIGVDFNRWATLATTTSFLVFMIVTLNFHPLRTAARVPAAKSLLLPAALVAMNLGSSIPLFDGHIVQSFPYVGRIEDVLDIADGDAPFPPQPEQCGESGCVAVTEYLHGGLKSKSAVPRGQ